MASAQPYFQLEQDNVALGSAALAAKEFHATRAIVCHDVFDAALIARLDGICDRAEFKSDTVEDFGHRRIEKPPIAGSVVALLLRRQPLLHWLEQVTRCRAIVDVEGRVVQTHAEPGDGLDWHDDVAPRRVLAVTIALTSPRYAGGKFELRRVGSDPLLVDYSHDRPGTALIFEVSRVLEHRLEPVSAGGPRRVFAGWFLAA